MKSDDNNNNKIGITATSTSKEERLRKQKHQTLSDDSGIIATSFDDSDEEQKRKAQSTNFVHIGNSPHIDTAHIGKTSTTDSAHITSNPRNTKNTQQKQSETEGGGAILGAVTGVGLGIAAGLAFGPLAPFAVPALAIAGYFAGMYAGDTVEGGLRGLSEGSFTDRVKGFMKERIARIDRTVGGLVGLVVGAALSPLLGPIAPMALPFLAFYGNRIGAELGEMVAPTLINAFKKAVDLFKDFKRQPKEKNHELNKEVDLHKSEPDLSQEKPVNKTTKKTLNSISAISTEDLKKAEGMVANFEHTSSNHSKTSLPIDPNKPKGMHKG